MNSHDGKVTYNAKSNVTVNTRIITFLKIRHQQPKSLKEVIQSINQVIMGWGNYFKGGAVKKLFEELDGYIRGRLRSFRVKRRTWKVLLYTIPKSLFDRMGLISLISLLNPSPVMG